MSVLKRVAPVLGAFAVFYVISYALRAVTPESWDVFIAWVPLCLAILSWGVLIAVYQRKLRQESRTGVDGETR